MNLLRLTKAIDEAYTDELSRRLQMCQDLEKAATQVTLDYSKDGCAVLVCSADKHARFLLNGDEVDPFPQTSTDVSALLTAFRRVRMMFGPEWVPQLRIRAETGKLLEGRGSY